MIGEWRLEDGGRDSLSLSDIKVMWTRNDESEAVALRGWGETHGHTCKVKVEGET